MKNLLFINKAVVLLSFVFAGVSTPVQAIKKSIEIDSAYVRATIPGTNVSSAYMNIVNNADEAIVLVGASGKISDRIEIHQHLMEDGMMKMRQVDSLVIAANNQVILQPSGYHLMIFNLVKPLAVGSDITVTLQFSDGKNVDVALPVQSIKRKKQKEKAHHHHH